MTKNEYLQATKNLIRDKYFGENFERKIISNLENDVKILAEKMESF